MKYKLTNELSTTLAVREEGDGVITHYTWAMAFEKAVGVGVLMTG